jgi:hypothetical protein
MRLPLLAALASLPLAAQGCNPSALSGAYGFQLAGMTSIAGKPTPEATVGRLVFDGSGHLSGYASVNFNGLFLGNPVTGTYELKPDCTLTWSLQDDSGAWQHFRGAAEPGLARAAFRQTDPGTDGRGDLRRAAATCDDTAFHGQYLFRMGGLATPFTAGGAKTVGQSTRTIADGAGHLSWKSGESSNSGTYTVDSDCFLRIDFGVPLRGILVDGGRTVLAVQTDPQRVAVATFSAQ